MSTQRHPADPVAGRAAPPARQLERLPADPEDAGPRDDEGVGRDVAADQDARAARRVEPLGVLAQDDVVDPLALAEPERRGHARVEPDGPEAHVEVEGDPERELRRDLGSVREADVGQPGGAEEDRVRRLAHLEGLARQLLAGPPVAGGARLHLLEGELEPPGHGDGVEDLERLGDHLGPDAVPGDDRDAVVRHGQARAAARSRLRAISAATRIASTMLSGLAVPVPARSKAVP